MRVLLILLLVLPLPAAAFEAVTSRDDFGAPLGSEVLK